MSSNHWSDEMLSAHLDSALSTAESGRVAEHLFSCADCSRRADLLRAVSHAVAQLPPEQLPRPLDLAFLREPAPRRGWARIFQLPPRRLLAPLAAAAAVLVVGLALLPFALRTVQNNGHGETTALSRGASQAGGNAFSGSSGSSAPQDSATGKLAAPESQLNGQAVPAAGPALANHGSQTVAQAGGLKLTVATANTSYARGAPVDIVVTIEGGSTDQSLYGDGVVVLVGNGTQTVSLGKLGGSSVVVAAHQSLTFTVHWAAGELAGSPQPGAYRIDVTVQVKSLQRGVTMQLPLTVSQ